MILEQLLEKKDLLLYLKIRLKHLKENFDVFVFHPELRDNMTERVKGRTLELERLLRILQEGTLKKNTKAQWDAIGGLEDGK